MTTTDPPPAPIVIDAAESANNLGTDIAERVDSIDLNGEEYELDYVPQNIRSRVCALRAIHEEQQKIYSDYRTELKALDLKYEKLYVPLYEKRKSVVTGVVEPNNDDEYIKREMETENERFREAIEQAEAPEQLKAAIDELEKESINIKGVPDFWVTAMSNHSKISQIITERDLPALHHLVDIRSEELIERDGFKLEFEFEANEYFDNVVLEKRYEVIRTPNGETMLENAIGTTINWKRNMNLCEIMKQKSQKVKTKRGSHGKKERRMITVTEPCSSFFRFFTPIDLRCFDEESYEYREAMHHLDEDFQIGYAFHDELKPQAILWFMGDVDTDDSDMSSDGDDDAQTE